MDTRTLDPDQDEAKEAEKDTEEGGDIQMTAILEFWHTLSYLNERVHFKLNWAPFTFNVTSRDDFRTALLEALTLRPEGSSVGYPSVVVVDSE